MKLLAQKTPGDPEAWIEKEWLISNGLGGYASGSLACVPTRKYHGYLVAALPGLGRTIMLNHLMESLLLPDGTEMPLNTIERPGGLFNAEGLNYLEEFYLDRGLPVWRYQFNDIVFEKCVLMTHKQNTVHIIYKLHKGPENLKFRIYPYFHFRSTSNPPNDPIKKPYKLSILQSHYSISREGFPPIRMLVEDKNFTLDEKIIHDIFFRVEAKRGYESTAQCWSPGFWTLSLNKEVPNSFVASLESWEEITALSSIEALDAEYMRREFLLKKASKNFQSEFETGLVLAADQFIIMPSSRIQDQTRALAKGEEVRSIIAGYHWFTDWGRDTMISLEGLTLCTGRYDEARWILRTFSYYIENGLIPNLFPEGESKGLYHTADASLWFFHAVNRYLIHSEDKETLEYLLPKLLEIYEHHMKGTLFGIKADTQDGLLIQGEEGYALTWMDAKVNGWVVTPRRGKAVEINALWYNALCLLTEWLKIKNPTLSKKINDFSHIVKSSFNRKFWNAEKGYLYDIVEGEKGNDDALRPNQLFSFSLDYPVLEKKYWESIFEHSKAHLLTPIGLRSLSSLHPDYKNRYDGDLKARDSAYHQGTVWSWLIGPYIDCWLKLYPDEKPKIQDFILNFQEHLKDAGIGYISEIFDATDPYKARGCIAQAWSIAEILRCLLRTKKTSNNEEAK